MTALPARECGCTVDDMPVPDVLLKVTAVSVACKHGSIGGWRTIREIDGHDSIDFGLAFSECLNSVATLMSGGDESYIPHANRFYFKIADDDNVVGLDVHSPDDLRVRWNPCKEKGYGHFHQEMSIQEYGRALGVLEAESHTVLPRVVVIEFP